MYQRILTREHVEQQYLLPLRCKTNQCQLGLNVPHNQLINYRTVFVYQAIAMGIVLSMWAIVIYKQILNTLITKRRLYNKKIKICNLKL